MIAGITIKATCDRNLRTYVYAPTRGTESTNPSTKVKKAPCANTIDTTTNQATMMSPIRSCITPAEGSLRVFGQAEVIWR